MPKVATPLNDTRIKAMKPKDKRFIVSDGGGVCLEVMTSGAKIWRYRYRLNGKQQPLVTIGNYPAVSLQDARERGRRYAESVAKGISPVSDAKYDRGALKVLNSVRDFADFWFGEEMSDKSDSYTTITRRALEKDVFPAIGNKAMADVTAGDVLGICDNIKRRGASQSALFTRNTLKRMFQFAISRQVAQINPAQQLVARFIATPQSRTRVLSAEEIGTVMRAVYSSNMSRAYKLAFHLLAITMVRKSELIECEWQELDLDDGEWHIPAERMKKGREHWVFLPHQATAMFTELRELSWSEKYVFPMRRGNGDRPIAKSTLNQAVRAMNSKVQHFVIHDLRRTASTHLNEMGHSPDAIEAALAHAMPGTRGIYNRAQYAEERRKIMQVWADFIDAQINEGGKVVVGRFRDSEPAA